MTVASQLLNTYSRKMATNDMAAYIVIYVECVFALKIVRTSPKDHVNCFRKNQQCMMNSGEKCVNTMEKSLFARLRF